MLNFIQAYFTVTFGAREDDERGASAVEYGLLIAGVAALIVVAVFAFGGFVSSLFSDTQGKIGSGTGSS